jgi:hypothetical protein
MTAKAAVAHSEVAADESAIQGVADAMRDAASVASEHAATVRAQTRQGRAAAAPR